MIDPRRHRHVVAADGPTLTYVCGCVNEVSRPLGVLRSLAKCADHRREREDVATTGEAYYAAFGLIADGRLRPTAHVAELAESLDPIPTPSGNRAALEAGCGVSPYAPALVAAGWDYHAVEPAPWPAAWMRGQGYEVAGCRWEDYQPDHTFGLILAAHCLEHMDDAPAALVRMAGLLDDNGELWVVVPDDTDPLNPDHLWFFDRRSLRLCAEAAGLRVVRIDCRKRIERENFLYLRAVKP